MEFRHNDQHANISRNKSRPVVLSQALRGSARHAGSALTAAAQRRRSQVSSCATRQSTRYSVGTFRPENAGSSSTKSRVTCPAPRCPTPSRVSSILHNATARPARYLSSGASFTELFVHPLPDEHAPNEGRTAG
jgi:hypothetical protein